MADLSELNVILLIRIVITLIVVAAVVRMLLSSFYRGRESRGLIGMLPSPIFNLLILGATIHMLAMITITIRVGFHIVHQGLHAKHLFMTSFLATIMIMFAPTLLTLFGHAASRAETKTAP